MIFRFLLAAGALTALAGCAVPVGQIRNGRFVSDDHGSLQIRNQTVAFDLHDLPPGSRIKKRVFYRLRPQQELELNLRFGQDYRDGVGAYRWRWENGEIVATSRRDPSSGAVFYRPGKRRPAAVSAPVMQPQIPAVETPPFVPPGPGDGWSGANQER